MDFDYHLESVSNRMLQLVQVLKYNRQMDKRHFTFYEKMQINCERSAMQSFKDYLFREIEHKDVNWFRVPESIELKIIEIQKEIDRTNWQPLEEL